MLHFYYTGQGPWAVISKILGLVLTQLKNVIHGDFTKDRGFKSESQR